jgi:hypothetical protein
LSADRWCHPDPNYSAWREQRIGESLMIALKMMMLDKLAQRTTQHPLPDRDYLR